MKKLILIGLISFFTILTLNAQQWTGSSDINGNLWRNGKIGIGVEPNSLLHVYSGKSSATYSSYERALIESNDHAQFDILSGQTKESSIYLKATNSSGIETFGGVAYYNENTSNYGLAFYSGNSIRMRILENGSIGVGTLNPSCAFHVSQGKSSATYSSYERALIESNDHTQVDILSGQNKESSIYLKATNNSGNQTFGGVAYYNENTSNYGLAFYSGNSIRMRVLENGYVGIGTLSPAYNLDVIGTIRAREIKVDLNGADFVFEKDYKLMPLNELEKFVKEQKHLPEIAPAKEMEKSGTALGDLNSKLLQKIEELTLYTIEQNKKIEQQNQELQVLKEEIEKLKVASR